MKIISVMGGEGSTFLIRAFRKKNYENLPFFSEILYNYTEGKKQNLSNTFKRIAKKIGRNSEKFFFSRYKIMRRPDVLAVKFFNDLNPFGTEKERKLVRQKIMENKKEVVNYLAERSSNLKLSEEKLNFTSFSKLSKSYLYELKKQEENSNFEIIVIAAQWGRYGLLEKVDIDETYYMIRDPFNALVSISKPKRHRDAFLKRGFKNINTREWIDHYLEGCQKNWIKKAEYGKRDPNGKIIRYGHFKEDCKRFENFPDIYKDFEYRSNPITEILNEDSIMYIYAKTKDLINKLNLKVPPKVLEVVK